MIAAHAHAECIPPTFDAPLAEQLASLNDCQRNAAYLAQLGHLLIGRGQYGEALEHLERALLFDPNLPAAQLDYAIALAGTGDLLSASQLLDSILAQPQIPADLRLTLIEAKQQITRQRVPTHTATEARPALAFSANMRYGRDSNLLGSPNITSLALTTPAGIIVLPLADGSAPAKGAYTLANINLEYIRQQPDGSRWEVTAGALRRTSSDAPDANTQQIELTLGYSQNPRTPWARYVSASWLGIDTTGGTRYTSQGLTAGLQLPMPTELCGARAGLDWQNRRLASNAVLSGYYTGVNAIVTCTAAWGGQSQLIAKIGQDRPKSQSRPGGVQTLASLRGVGIWPTNSVGLNGAVLMDIEYNTTRDASGYSALLDNAAVRQTRRLTARLEYQHPINQHVRATLGAEWSRQDANLALFRVQSRGPYAALRLVW